MNRRVVLFAIPIVVVGVLGLTSGLASLAYAQANTDTPSPTTTPSPTRTPTATPILIDELEPNDTPAQASIISVGTTTTVLTLYPVGDVDWYQFDAKSNRSYKIETNVDPGLDTYMELYLDPADAPIAANDDKAPENFGSLIQFNTDGAQIYYVKIINLGRSDPAQKYYSLSLNEVTAQPTATATAQITPGQADAYEPNYDCAHASLLGVGETINANFVPWIGSDPNAPDNDFYRVYVKEGLTFTCETSNLGSSTDTNMILYNDVGNVLGGNDDITLGNFASRVTTLIGYRGWAYVLVGQAQQVPPQETPNLTYSLRCTFVTPTATPTPTPFGGGFPTPPPDTRTPPPSTLFPTAIPSGTPTYLGITAVSTPIIPTREVAAVAAFDLVVYFDANQNQIFDPGEGVTGLTVELYDYSLSTLLARGLTGPEGEVRLTGSAFGQYEIRVPYLGVRRVVPANPGPLWIRIQSAGMPLDA
ncbi:MAG: hypothetical protein HY784_17090 [Chloroflexi bacterium]|nr:hypothetical protein [Chloroflexota bacterium]